MKNYFVSSSNFDVEKLFILSFLKLLKMVMCVNKFETTSIKQSVLITLFLKELYKF